MATTKRSRHGWLAPLAVALLLFCVSLTLLPAHAADAPVAITVSEPLLEVHTGPGRGYPIFYVAERGETVQILERRTEWFKVRTERQKEGWVSREQIEKTVMAEGVKQDLRDAVLSDFLHHHWELGFAAGRFDGEPDINLRADYHFTDNLGAELAVSQIAGTYSDSHLYSLNLLLQPYTDTRFEPYLTIGAGRFENRNRGSLVGSTSEINSTTANAGLGLRIYVMKNFDVRLDYRHHVSMTNTQTNDRFDEELIGFSFFF